MKRIITTLVVVCFLSMTTAAFGANGVKLGSVDIQKVLLLSNVGKQAKEQLAAKAKSYEGEKNAKEAELKKLKGELEKQNSLLSQDARSAKELTYQQKLRDYQRFLKDAQDDLQAKNDELTNKIVEEIVKTIQSYGRQNGYTIIFIKNDGMVYVDDNVDLTDVILKDFNASSSK